MARGYGWAGSVGELANAVPAGILMDLSDHHRALLLQAPSSSQVTAWRDEIEIMREALSECVAANPLAAEWSVVFEYELPMEGGRRPDVVVLAGETVVVLEFKGGMVRPTVPAVDQVNAYARDLAEYHDVTHRNGYGRSERSVIPLLVLTASEYGGADLDRAIVVGRRDVARWMLELATPGAIDLDDWLSSAYAPLPTLVSAAKRIFET